MLSDRHTRRSFLHGAGAARELAGVTDRPLESTAPTEDRSSLIVSVCRRAMACEFEVQLAANRNDNSMEHVFEALDLVESLESQLTVYRDDSEVIRLNRRASTGAGHGRTAALRPSSRGARAYIRQPAEHLISPAVRSQRPGAFRAAKAAFPAKTKSPTPANVLECSTSCSTATKKPSRSIGRECRSISTAWAKDTRSTAWPSCWRSTTIDDYLLHGGKSSVLARGNQPGSGGAGWRVGVRHPLHQSETLAELVLRNQALSTSGAGTQFFIRRGRRYGHILDPRSGYPAEGLYSATVIAPTAAEAEGLSTAFYVMGPERAGDFCAARPEIAALLVAPGEREGEVRVITFGLDSDRSIRPAAY